MLRPFEYTKVDRIIDVIFDTAVDVESQQDENAQVPAENTEAESAEAPVPPGELEEKRRRIIRAFADWKKIDLVQRSRTLFWTSAKRLRICCAVSKRYTQSHGHRPYWYAFRPKWDAFLNEADEAYVVLGCMDRNEAYALPYDWFKAQTFKLRTTERPNGGTYWHVEIYEASGGPALFLSKTNERISLAPYRFPIGGDTANG